MTSPTQQEEQWFKEQELAARKQAEARAGAAQAEAERDAHWMKCPKCGSDLDTEAYEDIEIDRCGSCNGVWLDVGELEHLTSIEQQQGFFGFLSRLR